MKVLPIAWLLVFWNCLSLSASEPLPEQHEQLSTVTKQELLDGLPLDDRRAKTARLEIDYCLDFEETRERLPVRLPVKTKEGNDADIVFLNSRHTCIPGVFLRMALLMVGKRVVDSASCWTCTRTEVQELLLEDVDGDGAIDVAFRGYEGFWGRPKDRLQSLPGDSRNWFYAYTITDKGFQCILPRKERELKVKLVYDTDDQPVKLEVLGLPKSFHVYEMVECNVSVTNISSKNLTVDPAQWFDLNFEDGGCVIVYCAPKDKCTALKPNETMSREVHFCLLQGENEVKLSCTYQPPEIKE